ncbi:hypothetical protein L7F22_046940 [Adiantum nelumboides]|nr:hypothetical protein [Adiantum nelumboides]
MSGEFVDKFMERLSPRLLLVFLSCVYKRYSRLFYGLMFLDDARERFQMFSIYRARKTRHKDVVGSKSKLATLFCQHKWFKGYCCVGAEVLYLLLYCISEEGSDSLTNVLQKSIMGSQILGILTMIVLPAWAIKQFVNVVQLCSALGDVFKIDDNQKANTHETLPERSFIVQVEAVDGRGLLTLLGSTQKLREI